MDLIVGEVVYIVRNKLVNNSLVVSENNYGEVISVDTWNGDDGWGNEWYPCFSVDIRMSNGEIINIKDNYSNKGDFFRKMDLIKKSELEKITNTLNDPKQVYKEAKKYFIR